MSTRALRAGNDLLKLHPDVEGGALTEAIFAIDTVARDQYGRCVANVTVGGKSVNKAMQGKLKK